MLGDSKVISMDHITCSQTSNVRCTKFQNLNVSCLGLQLSLSNPLKSSWEWRCSGISAGRHNFIAYQGAIYIRGLTVVNITHSLDTLQHVMSQGSFWVWAQPITGGITMWYLLLLAEPIHRMIPVLQNLGVNGKTSVQWAISLLHACAI